MKNLVISLGRLCNSRCVFCKDGRRSRGKGKLLPLDKVEAELSGHFALGCRQVVFLGGEPTIYKHLLPSVRRAKSIGYEVIEISTNGLHCDDRAYVQGLLDAGVSLFTVSIHSHLPEIEEELTGTPGALEKKVAGIKTLVECRRRGLLTGGLRLNPVINSRNFKELSSYIGYFHSIGIEDIHFNFIGGSTYMWPRGPALRQRHLMPTYNQVMPHVLEAIRRWDRAPGLRFRFGDIPICALPWSRETYRLMRRIADRYLGDLESQSWVSFGRWRVEWDAYVRREFKSKTSACRRCAYRDRCHGILKTYRDVHGFGRISPVEITPQETADRIEDKDVCCEVL